MSAYTHRSAHPCFSSPLFTSATFQSVLCGGRPCRYVAQSWAFISFIGLTTIIEGFLIDLGFPDL